MVRACSSRPSAEREPPSSPQHSFGNSSAAWASIAARIGRGMRSRGESVEVGICSGGVISYDSMYPVGYKWSDGTHRSHESYRSHGTAPQGPRMPREKVIL